MIRISLSYIFELSTRLEPLGRLPDVETGLAGIWVPLYVAQSQLDELYRQSPYVPQLRSSTAAANQLLSAIKVETDNLDLNRKIAAHVLINIRTLYGQFRTIFLADLGVTHSYFVTQKGGFDTISILAFGENLFPPELGIKVPEAIFDVREAGKCLAYELPTSSGFHIFRAIESVLRKYYAQVTGGAPAPKVRSIGVYVAALRRANKADPKILTALEHLNQFHRNPVVHPEAVLTVDEAITIFGLARSVIAQMLVVLPIPAPTTSSPLPVITPAAS